MPFLGVSGAGKNRCVMHPLPGRKCRPGGGNLKMGRCRSVVAPWTPYLVSCDSRQCLAQ